MTATSTSGVVAALAAAGCYALASVGQHAAAREERTAAAIDPRLLFRLMARRIWLLASIADLAGLVLQALALRWGSLPVVQVVVTIGLPIAVLLDQRLSRRYQRRPLIGCAAAAAGLALFVLASSHTRLSTVTGGDDVRLLAVGLTLLAAAAALMLVRLWTDQRAVLLGIAVGSLYAGSATALKLTMDGIGHPVALLTSWPIYALFVLGGLGLIVNQSAFQARPLAPALIALTLVEPIGASLIGVFALGETIVTGVGGLILLAVAGLGMLVGLIVAASTQARIETAAPPATVPSSVPSSIESPPRSAAISSK